MKTLKVLALLLAASCAVNVAFAVGIIAHAGGSWSWTGSADMSPAYAPDGCRSAQAGCGVGLAAVRVVSCPARREAAELTQEQLG